MRITIALSPTMTTADASTSAVLTRLPSTSTRQRRCRAHARRNLWAAPIRLHRITTLTQTSTTALVSTSAVPTRHVPILVPAPRLTRDCARLSIRAARQPPSKVSQRRITMRSTRWMMAPAPSPDAWIPRRRTTSRSPPSMTDRAVLHGVDSHLDVLTRWPPTMTGRPPLTMELPASTSFLGAWIQRHVTTAVAEAEPSPSRATTPFMAVLSPMGP